MQAAQRPLLRMAVIVLHERHRQSGRREIRRLPGLEKEAAMVAEHTRLDQHHVRNARRHEFHRINSPSCRMDDR